MSLLPLNREEVLDHLKNILGNDFEISDEQLRLFMHQLKKLIKQDEKKINENKENSVNKNSTLCMCHLKCSTENTTTNDRTVETTSSSDNDSAEHEKPKEKIAPASSFIMPWRLRGKPLGQPKTNLKTDPVELYQQYQDIWKQNRIPGQSNHAKLRWRVREKMLGEDPQPRPMARSSGFDMPKRSHRS